MLPIVDRYIAKEIFQTLVAVTVVLLLIFISMRLVRYFADVAAGNIPKDLVFTLVGIKTIKSFTELTPVSLFLSIILVLGRLYQDNEMTALSTGGLGIPRIMKSVSLIALPISLFMLWMALDIVPKVSKIEQRVVSNAEKNLEVTGISAGRFREGTTGNRIIYVEQVTKGNTETRNVFIHIKLKSREVVFSAAVGKIITNKAGERILVLENGYRYDGNPGDADYRMTYYKKHAVKLVSNLRDQELTRQEAKSTGLLLDSNKLFDIAELQWRISLPLAVFLLALIAVPISKVNPRQGRFGKLIIGFIFAAMYTLYLMPLAKAWVVRGKVNPTIGMWWLHAAMILLILFLVTKQQGFRWSLKRFIGRT